jgi:hypothetical protein
VADAGVLEDYAASIFRVWLYRQVRRGADTGLKVPIEWEETK